MSSKLLVAGGIAERRVRPLWDAIDTRQYKNALKLANTLLAKHPDSPYILALKALVLERMGKLEESLPLCLNAKDAGPVDDLTLSTLQIVFQRLDCLDLATSCYEHACAKLPNNLDLMMGLFNCYVREYSYVKQQQTAMKMYKLVGEERFLLWAVCSIQLQVSCGNGGEKLLSLAEALLKKRIESHGLLELEALRVYISVLEQLGKFEVALDVLAGKLGDLFKIENDKLRIQGKLLICGHEYAAAEKILRNILETCTDDWEVFLQYLDCSLGDDSVKKRLISAQNHHQSDTAPNSSHLTSLTEEEFDKRISDVHSFIEKLQQMDGHEFRRGPFLANLEIEKRRTIFGKANAVEFMQAFLEYYKRFGYLASFKSDVEEFLQFFHPSERPKLLKMLHESCSQLSSDGAVRQLGRAIAVYQVEEYLDMTFTASNDDCVVQAVTLTRLYLDNLNLSKDLDPQESMHGEELLTMVCNILMQLFWRTQHPGYLLEAIMILEFGLSIRRHISQYRIMLVHMYTYWAATHSAFEWYKSMEIKNILLESMTHHIFPQLLSSPLWSESYELMKEYLKFHEDYLKEAADHTFLVYRHINYSKVLEFVKFRERMQNSYNYLLVRIEQTILQLKEKADKFKEVENILMKLNSGMEVLQWSEEKCLDSLSFNGDWKTRPWWSPAPDECYLSGPFEGEASHQKNDLEYQCLREKQMRIFVKRRCLLPRLICLSIRCVGFLMDSDAGKASDMHGSCAEFQQLLVQYSSSLGFSFDEALGILSSIQSGQKSFKELKLDLVDWITFAVFYNAWKLSAEGTGFASKEKLSFDSSLSIDRLMELSVKELIACSAAPQLYTSDCSLKFIPAGSLMPTMTHLVTESFAWHGLILQSCVRYLLPLGKKKKKSGALGSHIDGSSSLIVEVIQCSIASFTSTIQSVKSWLGGYLDNSKDQELDLFLALLEGRGETDESSSGKITARPGCVLKILESSLDMVSELGPRIGQAVQTWDAATVPRKIINSHHRFALLLHDICESKLKTLKAMKLSV
ncbi:hypothetical protein SUGI_0782890 [Cryptomeria japonica]|uniref:N-terminal acetyltransferase B complex auxiliary subunit NAA25 n=1 Tax=Cryptomeria japonica TaxID=3369 RepID=UPI00241471E9|nr:N-terminal acetyltransferase B complex auxiliary subunit NAA25 [Cryptomeria japonica]GLJ38445.1 hypothetical protein SUGI_0782890 [Cryptomeria japonica]